MFVPDVYPEVAVVDDCPTPEMVKVMTDADGDEEPAPVTALLITDVEEPEPGESGTVSTVGDPDGNVTVMTVAALGFPPEAGEVDGVLPEFDEVPLYVPDTVGMLDPPVEVPDDEADTAVPDEKPVPVPEALGV